MRKPGHLAIWRLGDVVIWRLDATEWDNDNELD